ncbi:hypothetical protein [Pseudodesulfovibrio sp.]|uniref:hypothetical protein n=1 Tax=Pseudodesulfovibrio sp. TaxID=2035812 RepID=UPI00263967AB|nr:hypothetical protein [Pseudodesulfovibrio sp.]MDD3313806.1 hypothetical protein [Pseudodesulfovibrio sp.]
MPIPASSLVVVATALVVGGVLLFYRPLAGSSTWRAMVTPLASIMGSGFLVCAPLLYANIGNWAVWAMAGLLVLAYGVGAVIRFNIRYGEPLFERHPACAGDRCEHRLHAAHAAGAQRVGWHDAASVLEKLSHIALAGAYCVSVSYYLQLLAGFGLHYFAAQSPWVGKVLVTAILAGIGVTGALRGLSGIERVERVVVGLNLAMIAALVAGLVLYNATALARGTWSLAALPVAGDAPRILRLVMGMLIVVQGFETSRFLGSEHPAGERIRTMRLAQLVSAGIYVVFLGLMAVVVGHGGAVADTSITAIVGYSAIVAPVLPLLLTLTAVGSQFSASTADDAGCSGLLEAILRGRIPAKYNYLLVSAASICLTWLTDVYQIISQASRAFALFYFLQCLVALFVLYSGKAAVARRGMRAALFAALALVCLGVTLFGIPAG